MRLVLERIASLEEIRRSWTVGQVLDYNEALDLQTDAELNVAEAQRDAMEAQRTR